MQITSAEDIKSLGTILSIWAHPDDETFSCAGIMAAAVGNRQQIACVTATKGENGSQDVIKWPPKTLGKVRQTEMAAALKILGCSQHYWLDYPDGGCQDVPANQAVIKLKNIILRVMPDTILTFGPEGMTGHPDHATVSAWVSSAVRELGNDIAVYHAVQTPKHYEKYLKKADEKLNIFFNIDKPPLVEPDNCDIYFELPKQICRIKHSALSAMPSQTEAMIKLFGRDFLETALAVEVFVLA